MRLKKIGFLVVAFSLTMGMSICARAGTYKLELEATESKPTHYIKFDKGSMEFKQLKGYVGWSDDDDDNHKSDYQIDGKYVVVDNNGEPYRLTDGTKVIDFGDALFKNSNPDNVFYTGEKSINWWFATAFRPYDPDKIKVNSGFVAGDKRYATAELQLSNSNDIVGVGPNENEKNILRLGPNALSYDFRTESSLDDYTWTEKDAEKATNGSGYLSNKAKDSNSGMDDIHKSAYRADLRNGVAGFNINSITDHFNNYDSDSTGDHLSYSKYHRSSGYYIAGTIYRPIVSVNNKDKSLVLERYSAGNQTYYKNWEDALKTTDVYYKKEKSSAYGDWHRLVAAGKKLITSDYDDNDSEFTGACTMAFYVCEGYSINDNMENLYVVYINYMDPFDYCHSLVSILEDQSGGYGRYSGWDGKVLYNILCEDYSTNDVAKLKGVSDYKDGGTTIYELGGKDTGSKPKGWKTSKGWKTWDWYCDNYLGGSYKSLALPACASNRSSDYYLKSHMVQIPGRSWCLRPNKIENVSDKTNQVPYYWTYSNGALSYDYTAEVDLEGPRDTSKRHSTEDGWTAQKSVAIVSLKGISGKPGYHPEQFNYEVHTIPGAAGASVYGIRCDLIKDIITSEKDSDRTKAWHKHYKVGDKWHCSCESWVDGNDDTFLKKMEEKHNYQCELGQKEGGSTDISLLDLGDEVTGNIPDHVVVYLNYAGCEAMYPELGVSSASYSDSSKFMFPATGNSFYLLTKREVLYTTEAIAKYRKRYGKDLGYTGGALDAFVTRELARATSTLCNKKLVIPTIDISWCRVQLRIWDVTSNQMIATKEVTENGEPVRFNLSQVNSVDSASDRNIYITAMNMLGGSADGIVASSKSQILYGKRGGGFKASDWVADDLYAPDHKLSIIGLRSYIGLGDNQVLTDFTDEDVEKARQSAPYDYSLSAISTTKGKTATNRNNIFWWDSDDVDAIYDEDADSAKAAKKYLNKNSYWSPLVYWNDFGTGVSGLRPVNRKDDTFSDPDSDEDGYNKFVLTGDESISTGGVTYQFSPEASQFTAGMVLYDMWTDDNSEAKYSRGGLVVSDPTATPSLNSIDGRLDIEPIGSQTLKALANKLVKGRTDGGDVKGTAFYGVYTEPGSTTSTSNELAYRRALVSGFGSKKLSNYIKMPAGQLSNKNQAVHAFSLDEVDASQYEFTDARYYIDILVADYQNTNEIEVFYNEVNGDDINYLEGRLGTVDNELTRDTANLDWSKIQTALDDTDVTPISADMNGLPTTVKVKNSISAGAASYQTEVPARIYGGDGDEFSGVVYDLASAVGHNIKAKGNQTVLNKTGPIAQTGGYSSSDVKFIYSPAEWKTGNKAEALTGERRAKAGNELDTWIAANSRQKVLDLFYVIRPPVVVISMIEAKMGDSSMFKPIGCSVLKTDNEDSYASWYRNAGSKVTVDLPYGAGLANGYGVNYPSLDDDEEDGPAPKDFEVMWGETETVSWDVPATSYCSGKVACKDPIVSGDTIIGYEHEYDTCGVPYASKTSAYNTFKKYASMPLTSVLVTEGKLEFYNHPNDGDPHDETGDWFSGYVKWPETSNENRTWFSEDMKTSDVHEISGTFIGDPEGGNYSYTNVTVRMPEIKYINGSTETEVTGGVTKSGIGVVSTGLKPEKYDTDATDDTPIVFDTAKSCHGDGSAGHVISYPHHNKTSAEGSSGWMPVPSSKATVEFEMPKHTTYVYAIYGSEEPTLPPPDVDFTYSVVTLEEQQDGSYKVVGRDQSRYDVNQYAALDSVDEEVETEWNILKRPTNGDVTAWLTLTPQIDDVGYTKYGYTYYSSDDVMNAEVFKTSNLSSLPSADQWINLPDYPNPGTSGRAAILAQREGILQSTYNYPQALGATPTEQRYGYRHNLIIYLVYKPDWNQGLTVLPYLYDEESGTIDLVDYIYEPSMSDKTGYGYVMTNLGRTAYAGYYYMSHDVDRTSYEAEDCWPETIDTGTSGEDPPNAAGIKSLLSGQLGHMATGLTDLGKKPNDTKTVPKGYRKVPISYTSSSSPGNKWSAVVVLVFTDMGTIDQPHPNVTVTRTIKRKYTHVKIYPDWENKTLYYKGADASTKDALSSMFPDMTISNQIPDAKVFIDNDSINSMASGPVTDGDYDPQLAIPTSEYLKTCAEVSKYFVDAGIYTNTVNWKYIYETKLTYKLRAGSNLRTHTHGSGATAYQDEKCTGHNLLDGHYTITVRSKPVNVKSVFYSMAWCATYVPKDVTAFNDTLGFDCSAVMKANTSLADWMNTGRLGFTKVRDAQIYDAKVARKSFVETRTTHNCVRLSCSGQCNHHGSLPVPNVNIVDCSNPAYPWVCPDKKFKQGKMRKRLIQALEHWDSNTTDKNSIKCGTANEVWTFNDGYDHITNLSDGVLRQTNESGFRLNIIPDAEMTMATGSPSTDVFYTDGELIPSDRENNEHLSAAVAHYGVYKSYVSKTPYDKFYVGENKDNKVAKKALEDSQHFIIGIPEVESVNIHTPMAVSTTVEVDNELLIQNPAYSGELVLDTAIKVTVGFEGNVNPNLSNYGYGRQNYERYAYLDEINGVIRRAGQIKFPFPVMQLDQDGKDIYWVENYWIPCAAGVNYFYIPTWVKESYDIPYTVEYRNLAENTQPLLIKADSTAGKKLLINLAVETDTGTRPKKLEMSNVIDGRNVRLAKPGDVSDDTLYTLRYTDSTCRYGNKYLVYPNELTDELLHNRTDLDMTALQNFNVYEDREELEDKYVNSFDLNELEGTYVAFDKVFKEVIGRMYGFNIQDITDYPTFKPRFRNSDGSLSWNVLYSGVNNQDGYRKTERQAYDTVVPSNGIVPNENVAALNTGYAFKFNLQTIGDYWTDDDNYIKIVPTFDWVSYDGTQKEYDVDVYYNETVNGKALKMVRVGSDADKANKHTLSLRDFDLELVKETNSVFGLGKTGNDAKQYKSNILDVGAKIQGKATTDKYASRKTESWCMSLIKLDKKLQTYAGIDHVSIIKRTDGTAQYYDWANLKRVVVTAKDLTGVDNNMIQRSVQNWWGEYYLPSSIYVTNQPVGTVQEAVKGGVTGYETYTDINGSKKNLWFTSGYLIVNFRIVGVERGKERMYYNSQSVEIDAGDELATLTSSSMWTVEGYLNKKYINNYEFGFTEGDVVMYKIRNGTPTPPSGGTPPPGGGTPPPGGGDPPPGGDDPPDPPEPGGPGDGSSENVYGPAGTH